MLTAALLYANLAAGLTPTATSTTPVAGLAYDQLNDAQPRIRARIAATSAIVVFDLGSALTPDMLALISTTLPAAATVRWRSNSSDSWGSNLWDSGVLSNVTDPAYNGNVFVAAASPAARYWRLDIASANNPIDIGLIVIGVMTHLTVTFAWGHGEGKRDLSVRDENPDTGAEFAITLPKKRMKTITFDALTDAEVRTLFDAIDRSVGASGDILYIEDSSASNLAMARDSIWGSYREGPEVYARNNEPGNFWTRSLKLVERL